MSVCSECAILGSSAVAVFVGQLGRVGSRLAGVNVLQLLIFVVVLPLEQLQ